MRKLSCFVLALLCSAPASALGSISLVIVNSDDPGVGFNDPTPVEPIGGNTGTTLGEQRLIAVRAAADAWEPLLDSPVPILVEASFEPLLCLGGFSAAASARPTSAFVNTPNVPLADTWYPSALADRLAGSDTAPGESDIVLALNSQIGTSACTHSYYYGLDGNRQGFELDLHANVLHELAHGLGLDTFVDLTTGQELGGIPDVFEAQLFHNSLGLYWPEMTDAERALSVFTPRQLVWAGQQTSALVPAVLTPGTPNLEITSPASIAGDYSAGDATFGPELTPTPVTGEVAIAMDLASAAGPSATDACSEILNPDQVAGKIALVDRGFCEFSFKTLMVQAAGAIGIIIADNQPFSPPPPMGGFDSPTIPAVRIDQATGITIKTALESGPVVVGLELDLSRYRGADEQDRMLLHTPSPRQDSALIHWDRLATPDLLLEPVTAIPVRSIDALTVAALHDLGWRSESCGDSDLDRCDDCSSGVFDPAADGHDFDGDGICDAAFVPSCGDSLCDVSESCAGCPADCTSCSGRCGDGSCSPGEDCISCQSDCGQCPASCGDAACSALETCTNCPLDCGSCPASCGDNACQGPESCASCAGDCGTCPGGCGNGVCNGSESCSSCPLDCGACAPVCSNRSCDPSENCELCPGDCGACAASCGDGTCGSGEHCVNCPSDCGSCPAECGNAVCEAGESCRTCPGDCGPCSPSCGNGRCNPPETCVSCPDDCGQCG